ncbi:MAG: molybdopterin-dependent oxidoreductase [Planctomycetota bacterium]
MPQITIDGRPCEYDGDDKPTILQVALNNGIEIPHYCYHDGLSIAASCRICLAEVAQPNPRNDNKLELIPKLLPTCQTPAVPDSEVYTQSPKAIGNQKAVMELLLINHPLDCPVCDQAGECLLQDYSYKYGHGQSRFEENKIKQPKKDLGPNVLLYSDRCIMCSRCQRFTSEITGTNEIGIFGRGSSEQIDVFPGKPLDNELSGNVIDICPVGALLDKDFLMSMRVWNLSSTPSIDGITASGDNLWLEHNDDRLRRIKPRTNMDVNTWWTSDEIRYGWKFVHADERLTTPSLKGEGQLGQRQAINWNDALKAAVTGLRDVTDQYGSGSLALVVSPMLACEEAYLLAKAVVALDSDAALAVGPVPFSGEDKAFPGGYTVYAEKAPNARGVKRALGQIAEHVLSFDELMEKSDEFSGLLMTANYPTDWATPAIAELIASRFTVLLDTLDHGGAAMQHADVVLPGCTWAEKAGTFENVNHRLQGFEQAIKALEFSRPEGQIALDLLHFLSDGGYRQVYDPQALHPEMGDAFATDIHQPEAVKEAVSEAEYVQL